MILFQLKTSNCLTFLVEQFKKYLFLATLNSFYVQNHLILISLHEDYLNSISHFNTQKKLISFLKNHVQEINRLTSQCETWLTKHKKYTRHCLN